MGGAGTGASAVPSTSANIGKGTGDAASDSVGTYNGTSPGDGAGTSARADTIAAHKSKVCLRSVWTILVLRVFLILSIFGWWIGRIRLICGILVAPVVA